MGIFKDEYGDLVAWRVAVAAVAAVALAATVAFALLGPRPTEGDGGDAEATGQVAVTSPEAWDPKAGLREWLAGMEGADRLSGLGDATLEGLRLAVTTWEASALGDDDAGLSVVGDPSSDGQSATVRLRVTHAGGETWAEATLAEGAWTVEERPDGSPDETRVAMSDVGSLAGLMPEAVATEVSRQLAASGIEGAGEAWTTAGSVSTEGGVTRLTIWTSAEAGDAGWDAAFDEGFGMLEIAPAGAPLAEEARR